MKVAQNSSAQHWRSLLAIVVEQGSFDSARIIRQRMILLRSG
jgi:hypothetical protein